MTPTSEVVSVPAPKGVAESVATAKAVARNERRQAKKTKGN